MVKNRYKQRITTRVEWTSKRFTLLPLLPLAHSFDDQFKTSQTSSGTTNYLSKMKLNNVYSYEMDAVSVKINYYVLLQIVFDEKNVFKTNKK